MQAAGEAVAGVADAKDESVRLLLASTLQCPWLTALTCPQARTALLDVEALLHEGVSPLSQHAVRHARLNTFSTPI